MVAVIENFSYEDKRNRASSYRAYNALRIHCYFEYDIKLDSFEELIYKKLASSHIALSPRKIKDYVYSYLAKFSLERDESVPVNNILSKLEKKGKAIHVGHGKWAVPPFLVSCSKDRPKPRRKKS